MQSHSTWSVSLGRWGGVHVRLHMFFLLFAAFTLYLSWLPRAATDMTDLVWKAVGSLGILFASVVLHELGHYYAAIRLGGDGDDIVIGPLGGLTSMRPPREAPAEFVMHLAGPAVNLFFCLVCGTVLFIFPDPEHPGFPGILHPLAPQNLIDGASWCVGLKLAFWINWVLLLVNLLPAFPFDGGRALRAALSTLGTDDRSRRAAFLVGWIARITALSLLVVAWLYRADETRQLMPVWFSLVLLAIFLFFSAKHEQEHHSDSDADNELFGYDFSQGYTSLEKSSSPLEPAGFLERWLERRRKASLQRQRETEAEEERRVDDILVRLHEHGIDSLSDDDRSLLKRVSARYRQRNSETS